MSTLIVPCAGASSRFPNMNPKWMLVYPDGTMMVKKAVEGLDIENYERIIVTILNEHVERFQADEMLKRAFSDCSKFELCVLEKPTSCQAETVYETIEKCDVTGSFSVKDSDNYIKGKFADRGDFVTGIDITKFPHEIYRLTAKSFLMVNEHGIITDIVEKRIVSDYISVGLYGFSNDIIFREAFLHLRETGDSHYEIFLSHIIAYLIGMKRSIYKFAEAEDYEDWGTLKDWKNLLEKKKTLIVNIDGLMIEGNRERNLEYLKRMTDEGAQLIVLTSLPNDKRNVLEDLLHDGGIAFYAMVSGCYHSGEVLVNTFGSGLAYPGAQAINLKENDYIGDYLK